MYVKLFSSILESSIWSEAPSTRLVWITMLAMANKDGFVASSTSGLARRANLGLEDVRTALQILANPDDDSGSRLDCARLRSPRMPWYSENP